MDKNYIIKRSNGKIYVSIPNNAILGPNEPVSTSVPLNFIGKDKVSYGKAQNENFIWLAENFAGQKAPRGNVAGQLWYNYTSSAGQLLLSLKDFARQPDPSDPSTELEWASIPAITVMNTVPDGESSIMGRMVLTQNADSLMVLMKDKEWREIQTTKPIDKQYEKLLDIFYDKNKKYIKFSEKNNKKVVTVFNKGGTATFSDNGYMNISDAEGAYKFGANYFYELKVIMRYVAENDETNTITPVPEQFKTWLIKGSFYIDNNGGFVEGETYPKDLPDPRRIKQISQVKEVVSQTDFRMNMFDINVMINPELSNIVGGNGLSPADYENYVTVALNSNDHLGFKVEATADFKETNEEIKTQWSVLLKLTGIPPMGV